MTSHLDELAQAAAARLVGMSDVRPVFRRRELLDLGIADSVHVAMIHRHLIVRLRHGIYCAAEVLARANGSERHRIDVAASILAAGEPAWAIGSSAALLRDLPLPFEVPEQVYLLRDAQRDLRSLRQPSRHRLEIPSTRTMGAAVLPSDIGPDVRGVPCVSRLTAAVTAAHEVSFRWKVGLFDAVLWHGSLTQEDLLQTVVRWAHLGGTAELRRAVDRARAGAQTILETLSRLALVAEGLPEPELQVRFDDAGGQIGFVDMWWPGLRVIGEADGAVKYGSSTDLIREKVREDRLRALGLAVVRWTWTEIRSEPHLVAERIRAAARRAA